MEYFMVASFVMLLTIPLVIIFAQQSSSFNTEVTLSQSNKAAQKIIDAANTVYYLGPPSKRTITVYVPQGVKNFTVLNQTIEVNTENGFSYILDADTELNGSISYIEGLQTITVEAKNAYVQIN